jgi:protease I
MTDRNQVLKGKTIVILATDGFEEDELLKPLKALREAGAEVEIVSLKPGKIKAWKDGNWGASVDVDQSIEEVDVDDFDALMLPGGVINSDKLRMNENAVDFVVDFVNRDKPIAAICHAPWILIEAGMVEERRMTSWPSLKTDLYNAGANWVDEQVVSDRGLITSRKPADLPAFNEKMIEVFAQGHSMPAPNRKAAAPRTDAPH